MTFFRRERHLTALIRSADPVAAKPAHKPHYTPLLATCALLLVVWCRLPAPSGHLPAAETATLFPRSLVPWGEYIPPRLKARPPSAATLVPRGEGGLNRKSCSVPLREAEGGSERCELGDVRAKEQKGKRVARNEPGDGTPRRHAKPLRKRARRAPALLVASEPRSPEPQGGMIVIAVRPMTPEELHQELNTP